MVTTLLLFFALTTLIFFSGKNLSLYGDVIAEHYGLGKAWVGLLLIASVTSLPELTVGISSVTIAQSADLALGNILGSCVFNLMMLSLLDAFTPKMSVFAKASASHTLAGAMSIILFALVGMGLFLSQDIVLYKWIGLGSLIFISIYFLSMRILYHYEHKLMLQKTDTKPNKPTADTMKLHKAITLFVINALVVVGAALFLPNIAKTIAVETGLGESLVGTLFLAGSTVLPELAVTIGALRIGAIDLAVGNLFGSNLFNILILAIDDLFYTKGYVLKDASDANIATVFFLIIMTAIAIAGLTYRFEQKRFLLAWDALLIGLMYILSLVMLYYLRSG